jgi:hypothetical protein
MLAGLVTAAFRSAEPVEAAMPGKLPMRAPARRGTADRSSDHALATPVFQGTVRARASVPHSPFLSLGRGGFFLSVLRCQADAIFPVAAAGSGFGQRQSRGMPVKQRCND